MFFLHGIQAGRAVPPERRTMTRREVWGAVLLGAAAVVAVCCAALDSADRAAASQDLLLYIGVRASNLVFGLIILACFIAAVGLIFLVPALIRRIPGRSWRLAVGWMAGLAVAAAAPYLGIMMFFAFLGAVGIGDDVKIAAADGSSLLVSQDGFDGDSVVIYAEHDDYHYKLVRRAPEIAGWPRVKDQGCRLESGAAMTLTCGDTVLKIDPQKPAT